MDELNRDSVPRAAIARSPLPSNDWCARLATWHVQRPPAPASNPWVQFLAMLRIAIAHPGKPSRPLHYQFIAPRFFPHRLVFNAVSQSIKIYRHRFIHLYLYTLGEKSWIIHFFFLLFSLRVSRLRVEWLLLLRLLDESRFPVLTEAPFRSSGGY